MISYDELKFFLNSKFINVPEEWITACVDWIKSENPEQQLYVS